MPRTKKPPGTAVDPRNGRRPELVLSGESLQRFDLPPKRPAWARETRQSWELAWQDPISQAWTPGDAQILLRWADALDRAARALRRADLKPLVSGSTGQLTEHPSYATAARAVATAEKCETQLGFGAMNRERLGFTIGQRVKSLAEVNAEYLDGDHDDEPDPRAIAGHVEPG